MAHVIGLFFGVAPRAFDLLREIHRGRLEGVPLAEVQQRYPILWRTNLRQVVTHAGVIGKLFGALNGIRSACWEALRPNNASLTVVQWADGAGCVRTFDDQDHLRHNYVAPQRVGTFNGVQIVAHRTRGIGQSAR